MADAVIGSAYLQVIPKLSFHSLSGSSKDAGQQAARGFTGAFGKSVDSAKNEFSAKAVMVGTLMADAMKGVASTAVNVARDVIGGAMTGYKEYEQLSGGIETLFKDSSDTVMEYARNAYKTAGVSSNRYMETVTGFSASLLQSLGGDTEAAAKYADMAMTDMADNANKMGTSMESISNAYQGFAKQNYTMLDNLKLGYGGTKEEMQRLLDDASKIAGVEFDIDNYDDVIEAIHVMQESMGIAGTTFEEGQSTIEGSMNAAKAAWDNWLVGLADSNQDLDQLTGELVDTVVVAAGNLVPRVVEIVKSLATRVPSAVMELAPVIGDAVTQLLDGVTNGAFSKMVEAITPYAERIGTAVHGMMERFAPLAPVVSDIAGKLGGIFMTAVQGVTAGVENLAPIIATIAEHALPILSSALGVASDAFDAITTVMEPVGTFLSETLSEAIDWIGEKLEKLAEFVETCFSGIGEAADAAADFLKDPIGGIGKLFTGTGKTAQSTQKTVTKSFDGMGKSVGKSASSLSSNVSNSMKSMDKATSSAFSSMSTDASKQMGKVASTATDKMGKVASTVDSKTRDAQSKAAANSAAMQRDLAAKYEAMRAENDAKMARIAAQTDAQMAAAKANAAKQAEAMRTSLSTSFNNAATDATNKATSIKNAWDKSYTMKVSATADTSKATSTLTTFRNSWNGYNISGTATNNPGSANSSLWGLWNDWNGSTFRFYSSASTYDADESFARLYYKWNNSKVHFIASGGNAAGGIFSAAGAIVQKHAKGFIADRPGRGVDITRHIAGEAGGEAIIPLTNKHYVRPFAETVASFIDGGNGGVDIHDCTFVVRQESDIAAIGRAINREADRQRRARL